MSIKQRLLLVSQYIRERRFTEAKAILVQLDHPIAHKWLAQLDDLMQGENPAKVHPRRRIHPYLIVALAFTLISIGILASVWFVLRPPTNSPIQLTAEAFNTAAARIQNTNIYLLPTLPPTLIVNPTVMVTLLPEEAP